MSSIVISSMFHALVCLTSLRLSTLHSSQSPSSSASFLIFHFIFYVGRFGEKFLVRFREWGVWLFGQQRPSHRLWAQVLRRLPHLLRPLKSSSLGSSDSRPSNLHDWEISDNTIGRALSSPLFTQEREEPAGPRQAYHSLEESLLSSQSSSVCHVRTERPVSDQFDSLIPNVRENPCRGSENEQIRILLERQKKQILADCGAEIQKHEFQADCDRRSIQKLNGVIESQRGEIYRALQGDEQLRRYQQLLHERLLEQNRELREAHEKSLNEMEELKRFEGSTSRRKLIEDRDTILELTAKIQEPEWSQLHEWFERF